VELGELQEVHDDKTDNNEDVAARWLRLNKFHAIFVSHLVNPSLVIQFAAD
jgi:hypothetical protein